MVAGFGRRIEDLILRGWRIGQATALSVLGMCQIKISMHAGTKRILANEILGGVLILIVA